MLAGIHLKHESETPLYRQLYDSLKEQIVSGQLLRGERLPANRELVGMLGLSRDTIINAFDLLEADGLIKRHVGRGTFVEGPPEGFPAPFAPVISFSASRPSEDQFPLEDFRATCKEVLESPEAASILQLGSAGGYGPLRRFILNEIRKRDGIDADDEILITSGCQQGLDLIQRVLAPRGETVLLEDPVYPGVRNVFERGGARVIGVPVGDDGLDVTALERILEKEQPRLLIVTPNFQNPTGATIPELERARIADLARRAGVLIVENDLYGPLRYAGSEIPRIKSIDRSGATILLGSFSKIAFPGLRVGWAIGPRPIIARLTEAKEACDLHSDQLSQAVLLRFAQSGRLAAHYKKTLATGAERLRACVEACARELPPGSKFTRPSGGMNVWVTLPEPMDAADLAARAAGEGVSFLPGKYFAVSRPQTNSLRLSFAGLSPEKIERGLNILGKIFRNEYERVRRGYVHEPAPAMV